MLWSMVSRCVGFGSHGAWPQLLQVMGNLPGPGIKPSSPALAGRFLPTAPPGKSQHRDFCSDTAQPIPAPSLPSQPCPPRVRWVFLPFSLSVHSLRASPSPQDNLPEPGSFPHVNSVGEIRARRLEETETRLLALCPMWRHPSTVVDGNRTGTFQ